MPGWAFSHLISRETLTAQLPYKSLKLQSPPGPHGVQTATEAAHGSSARASCPPSQTLLDPGSPRQDKTPTQHLQLGTGSCRKHPKQV